MPAQIATLTERELRSMPEYERLERSTMRELPYSEVCVHMRVAGDFRPVVELAGGMAQILNADGSLFSLPVTRGEAGLSWAT